MFMRITTLSIKEIDSIVGGCCECVCIDMITDSNGLYACSLVVALFVGIGIYMAGEAIYGKYWIDTVVVDEMGDECPTKTENLYL